MCSYWKVETTSGHTWKLFFCVHHLESFQLKLEPQSTQVGAKIMVSPHCGDDMLAQVWSWSEYLSTYFTYEISFVNHLYLLIGELHFYDNFSTASFQMCPQNTLIVACISILVACSLLFSTVICDQMWSQVVCLTEYIAALGAFVS